MSSEGIDLYRFLLSKSVEVALADSVSQRKRSMPAASRRGNDSGPLVLLERLGNWQGQGAARAILSLSYRSCSPTKAGRCGFLPP